MFTLNPLKIPQVQLQFRLSSKDLIPPIVKIYPEETGVQKAVRENQSNGVLVGELTIMDCSVASIPDELETMGYVLVGSRATPRWDNGGKRYFILQYNFVQEGVAKISEGFITIRDTIKLGLQKICDEAIWCSFTHVNEFFMNGNEGPLRVLNIFMKNRSPLFKSDGQPVMARPKVNGVVVSDIALPVKAKIVLNISTSS